MYLDDDSEPILGQWFEETIAPPETNDTSFTMKINEHEKNIIQERINSIVPEKGEPHGVSVLK